MFLWDFFAALIVTFIFIALLVGLLGWGRREEGGLGGAILFLFLILLFGIWAGGAWITPVGPELWGVAWLPLFFIGLILALIFAAAIPPARWRPRTVAEARAEARAEESVAVTFGVFFWILLAILLVAVVAAYV